MSSTGAAACAAFVDEVVADLVAPPMSAAATSASSLEASPMPGGIGENAGQPTTGAPAGDVAGLPATGAAAMVESAGADDDVAPPFMGVPPSSDEEEELLADIVGAQPFPGADFAEVGAQTEHVTPILAFDAHDVAVQTADEVIFSSFVGDTSQEALATAIRALSREDRDRLVGALRLAEEQPLVDVAPTVGAGDPSSSSVPTLDLLDFTPGITPAPTGVVDPGPSPATARTFWEEQDATAVAEMAAAKPVPDDDLDAEPPTSLELFLDEQDAAAKAKTSSGPPASGASSSSAPGPGPKKPFKKAPIKFLDDTPTKPKPTGPSSGDSEPAGGAAADTAFIRQEQMARSPAGLRLLHDGATYQDAIIARELAEQRQAADDAALARAKPKGATAALGGHRGRPTLWRPAGRSTASA
ncbi:unnamed protein product [Symbiodinium sp. KB8]|nr:unnamed protein product [Symbiodinium sp. KB8]